MKKYYIGLIVITLVVAGLFIYVVGLGVSGKQDKKTYEAASRAAEKLNSYINSKRQIPENLAKAGIEDVPDTITYEKISSTRYKFCVTYKAARGYGGVGIDSVVTGALYGSRYAGFEDDYYSSGSSYEPSTLYLSYYYDKGENCQTIKPYLSSSSYYNDDDFDDDLEINYNPQSSFNDLYQQSYNEYCTPTVSAGYEDYCTRLQENMQ